MKKLVILSFITFFFACDDGDLDIETIDFDSVNPEFCDTLIAEDENGYVLFKINDDETLILELPSAALKNQVVVDTTFTVTETGTTAVTFRIFDDAVTSSYFCSRVPEGTPLLLEEIPGKEGQVFITTSTEDEITYTHSISLSGISLETGNGQRITDLTINEFGEVTTVKPIRRGIA